MALTKASDILGLEKKVKEIAVPIDSLSASKVSVDLPDYTATNAAGAFEEIDEKIENIFEYSTNEKKIGKWIDGSDLYELTVIKNNQSEGNNEIFNLSILNVDKFISVLGFAELNGTIIPFGYYVYADNNNYVSAYYRGSDHSLRSVLSTAYNGYNITATIRYTKTAPVTTKKTTKKKGGK